MTKNIKIELLKPASSRIDSDQISAIASCSPPSKRVGMFLRKNGSIIYHMKEKLTSLSFSILSLYRTDYTTTLHARAMAKKLSVSHVTLLPHLKRLEKARILLSRKVGKNKEYHLNPNNSLTKHYLTITEELATINYLEKNFLIKKITDQLSSLDLVGPLLLFGSYTKDYSNEESDIDIFHLSPLKQDQQTKIKKSGKTYGKEINIKTASIENFNNGLKTGDILIKEILGNHIILQNPGLFINLVWRNYSER
jgi:DNA-binding transcriptional ArsR family regulator